MRLFFLLFLNLYHGCSNFCSKINIIQLCELLGDYDLKINFQYERKRKAEVRDR